MSHSPSALGQVLASLKLLEARGRRLIDLSLQTSRELLAYERDVQVLLGLLKCQTDDVRDVIAGLMTKLERLLSQIDADSERVIHKIVILRDEQGETSVEVDHREARPMSRALAEVLEILLHEDRGPDAKDVPDDGLVDSWTSREELLDKLSEAGVKLTRSALATRIERLGTWFMKMGYVGVIDKSRRLGYRIRRRGPEQLAPIRPSLPWVGEPRR